MTDRERLIELIKDLAPDLVAKCPDCCDTCTHGDCVGKLADHLLANGVIVPPAMVGDKVYYISAVGNIIENEITHIGSYCKGKHYYEQHGIKVPLFTSTFLLDTDNHYRSYEEAEKALAERIGK